MLPALDDARDHVLAHREEQVELYCFYQYLRLEIKPSLQQKESLVRYIRKLLWEDGEVRPYLFLMLMKLDETMAQNPLELYRSMASLFNQAATARSSMHRPAACWKPTRICLCAWEILRYRPCIWACRKELSAVQPP